MINGIESCTGTVGRCTSVSLLLPFSVHSLGAHKPTLPPTLTAQLKIICSAANLSRVRVKWNFAN